LLYLAGYAVPRLGLNAPGKRDVPYQSLLKVFLAEKVEEELRHGHA
jgi:hypothetical protein